MRLIEWEVAEEGCDGGGSAVDSW